MLRAVLCLWASAVAPVGALRLDAGSEDLGSDWEFEPDTVMSLALYKVDASEMNLKFINSLRNAGFRGRIILGVSDQMTDKYGYMKRARVMEKRVKTIPCEPFTSNVQKSPPAEGLRVGGSRALVCTEEFPKLYLESSRHAYALRWLQDCKECTGWALFADFRDVFFQRPPFTGLTLPADPEQRVVYFTEEFPVQVDSAGRQRGVSTHFWMVRAHVEKCFGHEAAEFIDHRPMLNIGTTMGNRPGMLAYFERLLEQFNWNISPDNPNATVCGYTGSAGTVDQGPMNFLHYNLNAFPYAKAMPWGKWLVNTMREPCEARGFKSHSMGDYVHIENCTVHNPDGSVPSVLHQYMTCLENFQRPCARLLAGVEALHVP